MHPHKSTTHDELYFHIRVPHTSRAGKRFKAATVFAREKSIQSKIFYEMSITRCREEDNFSKASGRSLARRRWMLGQTRFVGMRPTYDDALQFYTEI